MVVLKRRVLRSSIPRMSSATTRRLLSLSRAWRSKRRNSKLFARAWPVKLRVSRMRSRQSRSLWNLGVPRLTKNNRLLQSRRVNWTLCVSVRMLAQRSSPKLRQRLKAWKKRNRPRLPSLTNAKSKGSVSKRRFGRHRLSLRR